MSDLFSHSDGSRDEYRRFRQREHNDRQKRFARVIGENFASFALLAIMALTVGSIWTETGLFTSVSKFIGDAAVTVVLYVLADVCASFIGTQGGKLDDDYIKNHGEYLALRERVRAAGLSFMEMFCDWQVDIEYEYYLRRRCKDLKLDYAEYVEKYRGCGMDELLRLFPPETSRRGCFGRMLGFIGRARASSTAAKIFALGQIKHIELTPDILMTDGKARFARGGVPTSGEEYVERHTVGALHILVTALFAVVAAVPVFELREQFSVGMLIYTVFKLALMVFRMYRGFSRGARAFNSVEPKHLQSKIKYLYLYLEFLDARTYEQLTDKYSMPRQ